MHYRFTLLPDAALPAFRDLVLPLAGLHALPDVEQRRRIQAALDGLGLGTDERTAGGWLFQALGATGQARQRLVGLAGATLPGIVLHRSAVRSHELTCGTFDVHAWLLQSTTGSELLIPRPNHPQSAEFHASHFRRYSCLTAPELAAIPSSVSFEGLRDLARGVGDAPQWPANRVAGYVERCIGDSTLILRWVEQGRREGLAAVSSVDNTDWDFD